MKHDIWHLMNMALDEAKTGLAKNEVPVGAVLYDPRQNKILSSGHNMCEEYQNKLMHAEIISLAKMDTLKYKKDLWCFVSLEPCAMCVGQLLFSGMTRLYYSLDDYKYGFLNGNYMNLKFNSNLEIYSGIMDNKSRKLLKDFFRSLRKG